MPVVYDFLCKNPNCEKAGVQFESLLKRWDSPDPPCPGCGKTLERQFCAPRLGWVTKQYTELDLKQEHREAGTHCPDGYWVTSKQTPDGKPRQELIRTRQEMREFAEREGLKITMDALRRRSNRISV